MRPRRATWPGRPGTLPGPLRTGRARFRASGSGKLRGLAGGQKCWARAVPGVLPVAVSVHEAEFSRVSVAGDQLRVADRLPDRCHPAGLAGPPGAGRRPGQSRAESPALPGPACRSPPNPRRTPPPPQDPRILAVGPGHRRRLDPDQCPSAGTMTRQHAIPAITKDSPGTPWNPASPARQPGRRHIPNLKSRSATQLSDTHQPVTGPRE
jgi:hypothetical protein